MKFMNMKRFASTVMAGVLTLSLAVPAFAAGDTTTVTGTYQEIEIAVEIPTTGTAQINPYGLPVSIDKSDKTTVEIVNQQITTQPMSIKNQGTVALDVNATLAVLPKGDEVSIKGGDLASTDKGKEINVVLEVAGLNDSALAVASNDKSLDDAIIDKYVDDATWTSAATLTAPLAAAKATTVTPAKSSSTMAVLGAAEVDGKTTTYGAKSIALFRLTGKVNADPVKADGTTANPWAETDGFTATVVFKFTPHAAVAASARLSKTTATVAAGSSDTVTVTFDAGESGLTATGYAWKSSDPTKYTVTGSSTTGTVSGVAGISGSDSAKITCEITLSDGSKVVSDELTVTAS